MLKRRILLLLAALAALCGVLALVLWPKPEPEYGGKKMSEWVTEFGRSAPQADTKATEAIKRDTNALPYLMEWVGYEKPAWKNELSWAVIRIFEGRWHLTDQGKGVRREGATYVLLKLGAEAAPEIGNLSRIANDPKRSRSRVCALLVLGNIGDAALPAIIGVLTNEQSRTPKSTEVRTVCAGAIRRSAFKGSNPDFRLAEPVLLSMREDPDFNVRRSATEALRAISRRRLQNLREPGNY